MAEKKYAVLGRLALLGATLIWGSSFIILKATLDAMPTLWILAIRFTGAALLMLLLGVRDLGKLKDRHYLKYGVILGLILFAAYTLQTFGLEYTTPGKNAFLTATYCVLVPFLWWIMYRKRPDRYNVSAAVFCIAGMALVSLNGSLSINIGDALTMACGLFYALQIIVLARSVEGRSVVILMAVQFAVASVLCWITAPMVSPFPEHVPNDVWWSMAYLCFMCTGICFLLQAYGQKYTPPQSAAIILTLESVFGTALSVLFYHETLSIHVLIGFVLIFLSVIISETKLDFLKKRPKLEQ